MGTARPVALFAAAFFSCLLHLRAWRAACAASAELVAAVALSMFQHNDRKAFGFEISAITHTWGSMLKAWTLGADEAARMGRI